MSYSLYGGRIGITFSDFTEKSITSIEPMDDSDGLEYGIKYNFYISIYENDYDTTYAIKVKDGDLIDGLTLIDDGAIKYSLSRDGDEVASGTLTSETVYTEQILISGEIGIDYEDIKYYELTLWVGDNLLITNSTCPSNKVCYSSIDNLYLSKKVVIEESKSIEETTNTETYDKLVELIKKI